MSDWNGIDSIEAALAAVREERDASMTRLDELVEEALHGR